MEAYSPINNQSNIYPSNYNNNNQNPQFSRSLDNSYVRNYHANPINSPQPFRKYHFQYSRDQEAIENYNLNDSPSFARNFKSRLFNVDPKE